MSILLLFPVLLPLVTGACVCFIPKFEDAKLRKRCCCPCSSRVNSA